MEFSYKKALFYIDESGSMTSTYSKNQPYFVICLVKVLEKSKLKHLFKNFLIKNPEYKFIKPNNSYELKGTKLSTNQKINLANYLKRKDLFELFFIKVNNRFIQSDLNDVCLYSNKARAFNYLLSKNFEYLALSYKLNEQSISLNIDNRNLRNEALLSLEDYLNLQLCYEKKLFANFHVKYYDSQNVLFIQLADFFSNLYYSSLFNGNICKIISDYKKDKIVKSEFIFPLRKI